MAVKYVTKFSFPKDFGFTNSFEATRTRARMAGGGATAGSAPSGPAPLPGPSPAAEASPLTRTPTAVPLYGNPLDDKATTDIDNVLPTRAGAGAAMGSLRRSVNERNMKGNRPMPTKGAAGLSPLAQAPTQPKAGTLTPVANLANGGRLTAGQRNAMPSSEFALPGRGAGPKGKGSGSYPVPDAKHARLALSMVSAHGNSAEKAAVRAKVHAKYPNIGRKG